MGDFSNLPHGARLCPSADQPQRRPAAKPLTESRTFERAAAGADTQAQRGKAATKEFTTDFTDSTDNTLHRLRLICGIREIRGKKFIAACKQFRLQ
jgi:hypothetical protein